MRTHGLLGNIHPNNFRYFNGYDFLVLFRCVRWYQTPRRLALWHNLDLVPTCTAGHPEHQTPFQFLLPFPPSPHFPITAAAIPSTPHCSTFHYRGALVPYLPPVRMSSIVPVRRSSVMSQAGGSDGPSGPAGQSELGSASLRSAIGRPRLQYWVRFH